MADIVHCGNTTFARKYDLKNGATTSCGCLRKERAAQRTADHAKTLVGKRFGHLTVIRPTEHRLDGVVAWECKCDCGTTIFTKEYMLKSGRKTSCGCAKATNGAQV